MEPHFVSLGYLWRRKELLKLFAIGQGKLRGTNRGTAKEDEISRWHSLRFSCVKIYSSRPPSVRVDHGYSILIVCLAGASAAMTVKANA